MRRPPPAQQTMASIPFRTLFFLLLSLPLLLFLLVRVIPCILCDLSDLCKPAPRLADPSVQRTPHPTQS